MIDAVKTSEKPNGWENVKYTCITCEYTHHPDERISSDVFEITLCPECRGRRARVTHDLTSEIVYKKDPVSVE
jgi:Zn finger protein HypA/HybF involved in hydrogenase expression